MKNFFARATANVAPAFALCLAAVAPVGGATVDPARPRPSPVDSTGTVRDARGRPIAGAFISARDTAAPVTVSVVTDAQGRFRLPASGRAIGSVTAHAIGFKPATRQPGSAPLDFKLDAEPNVMDQLPSSSFLAALPAGETKRRFMLDCTGCHQFDQLTALPGGKPRAKEDWATRTSQMVNTFGPQSGFPIIAPHRNADSTAVWLASYMSRVNDIAERRVAVPKFSAEETKAVITEYDVPAPRDLPHDLMLDADGKVIITGMFTAQMYVLDPASGRWATEAIPLQGANPRALHVESNGTWWALLGAPKRIARRDGVTKQWTFYDVGMYGHSLAPDSSGGIWFNGHFTANPSIIGRLDAKTFAIKTYEIPPADRTPTGGGPIPYEIKAADDGTIWGSELHGNRVYSLTPSTGQFRTYVMPTTHSGPRRLDIGADGTVWIPAYSAGVLARLDPKSGKITEHALPTPDALPYIARVDRRTGNVWVATGASDVIARFEPGRARWTEFRLPTKGALIRHIDIDSKTGAVWAAYGASPGIPGKIARLEVRN